MNINHFLLMALAGFYLGICVYFHNAHEYERKRKKSQNMFFLHLQKTAVSFQGKIVKKKRKSPRFWVKTRSSDWWERIVKNEFLEEDWLENFRCGSSTFKFLCQRLDKHLKPKDNTVRKPLSVEKKVAITLYKFASCAEYRVIANQFGTHKCIVHKCVYQVTDAILAELKEEYLSMPNEHECMDISASFQEMCGIPGILGAIDGTHIPILPPKDGYRDFLNRKGWPSYNVLAVVDNMYRFRYATCKHPGSAHDAKVLKDSMLYTNHLQLIPQHYDEINGTEIPYFLLGDPAYPLLPWLIKGYKGNITPEEESFNVYHSLGRVVVENAFGRLKSRFRCLCKRLDISYKFVPKVVVACIILHNIFETRKEIFVEKWRESVETAELMFPQPARNVGRNFDDLNAAVIRDTLKNFMLQYPLRKSKLF